MHHVLTLGHKRVAKFFTNTFDEEAKTQTRHLLWRPGRSVVRERDMVRISAYGCRILA